jgi:hypothetical protein
VDTAANVDIFPHLHVLALDKDAPSSDNVAKTFPRRRAERRGYRVIDRIDRTLSAFYLKTVRPKTAPSAKMHSLFTMAALWITEEAFRASPGPFRAACFVFCAFVYVIAFFEWRLFLRARGDGLNTGRNVFFQDSAGALRKTMFIIALLLYGVNEFAPMIRACDLKYAASIDVYFQQFGVFVLGSSVYFVILVEFFRILTEISWSNKKHFTVVIALSLITSAFRTIILYALWGNSVLWWNA